MPKLATIFYQIWHANFGIKPTLAEIAPPFYRMTDVPFKGGGFRIFFIIFFKIVK